jgi:hypothetical protein
MISDYQEVIKPWLSLKSNLSMSVVFFGTCLLDCGTQVWSIKTVDGNREGQTGSCHVDGPRAVKDKQETWTKEPMVERQDRWLKHRCINKQVYMWRSGPC